MSRTATISRKRHANGSASDHGRKVRKVTIVFTDLDRFLTWSQNLSLSELATFMDMYYRDAGYMIRKFGGTVDKFFGDSVMAIFNAPESVRNHERRAVQAAIALRAKLSERWPELRMSVGVATGTCIVGNFGPTFHRTYTAFGDVVQRAVQLERQSRRTDFKILLDAETYRGLGVGFPARKHARLDPSLIGDGDPIYEI